MWHGLTVRLVAFRNTWFHILVVYFVFGAGDLILRAADFPQPFQAFIEIKTTRSGRLLRRRRRILSVLLDA